MSYSTQYKLFVKLLLIGLFLLSFIFALQIVNTRINEPKLIEKRLLPELLVNINTINNIKLVDLLNGNSIILNKRNDEWQLLNSYPIAANKIINFLLDLSEIKLNKYQIIQQELTVNDDAELDYAAILINPIKVLISDDQGLVNSQIVFGKTVSADHDFVAILANEQLKKLYFLNLELFLSVNAKDWIVQPFSIIDNNSGIQQVTVLDQNNKTLVFEKESLNSEFALTGKHEQLSVRLYNANKIIAFVNEIIATDCEDVFVKPQLLPANKMLQSLGLPIRSIVRKNTNSIAKISFRTFAGVEFEIEMANFADNLVASFNININNTNFLLNKDQKLLMLSNKLQNYYFSVNKQMVSLVNFLDKDIKYG